MTRADDTRAAVLRSLGEWAERGWIRSLDAALARFIADLCPDAPGAVLLATALVATLEGQGHTCLVLDELADAGGALPLSDEARDALARVLGSMPRSMPQGTDAWRDVLAASDAVHVDRGRVADRDGTGGNEPLVLCGGRLYLRRYWRHERRVAARIRVRSETFALVDDDATRRNAACDRATREALDRLMPSDRKAIDDAVDWQKIACALALRGRLSIITGGPGTGKTFTAARVLALLHTTADAPERLRVALAAPTGKAAARLRQSIDEALGSMAPNGAARDFFARIGPARTLHSLLGTRHGSRHFRHDASHPLDVDVLVVDEASMIHIEMMDALLDALPESSRLLLIGDKDQLASVEAGAVLGELCRDAEAVRYTPETARYVKAVAGQTVPASSIDLRGPPLAQQTIVLRRSQRFGGAIDRLAQAVNRGDVGESAALLRSSADDGLAWIVSPSPSAIVALAVDGAAGYRRYVDALRSRPSRASNEVDAAWVRSVLDGFDRFRVLCAVRRGDWGVEQVNVAIEEALTARGHVAGGSDWYEGRPVLVTRNDASLGVFNGDIGIALGSSRGAGLRVYFTDGPRLRSIGVAHLAHVETAWAMTVHKAQGSEFDHAVLVLPADRSAVTTRELVYTGVTRARSAFTLVSSRGEALADAIGRTTRRSSGLQGFIREG